MAYGKEIFRDKYRETNNSLALIKDNYYELDHEYQMLAKRVKKAIEYIKNKQEDINNGGNDMSYRQLTALLEILGDKE